MRHSKPYNRLPTHHRYKEPPNPNILYNVARVLPTIIDQTADIVDLPTKICDIIGFTIVPKHIVGRQRLGS